MKTAKPLWQSLMDSDVGVLLAKENKVRYAEARKRRWKNARMRRETFERLQRLQTLWEGYDEQCTMPKGAGCKRQLSIDLVIDRLILMYEGHIEVKRRSAK